MEVRIGLEIHAQLTALKSKLFCGCSNDYRGKEPNTVVCPVCLGIPGALPVINEKAIELAVMAALALNCKISDSTSFFRKNYFYPDMSKNFQISQYDRAGGIPLAVDGNVVTTVNYDKKKISIRRVHLEEDPARLVHPGPIDTSPYTLVDYNRSGVALLEIVTEPDLHSPKEARIFLRKLRSILEHLGVSDGSLEGAMRCDANISLLGGPRVEVKNISSFKEVERALGFEIMRQKDLMTRKVHVEHETRHWDELRRITISLRTKEEEHDYRYFPEPDLMPITITRDMVNKIKAHMPELPDARRDRFVKKYRLPAYDAEVLTSDKALADFFEKAVRLYPHPKDISNWLMTDFLRYLYEAGLEIAELKVSKGYPVDRGLLRKAVVEPHRTVVGRPEITELKIKPADLVEMLKLIDKGVISGKIAKVVLREMVQTGKAPEQIVKEHGLLRIGDREELDRLAEKVFAENAEAVKDALTDEKAAHYLIGQLMKLTRGRADPELANKIVLNKLAKLRKEQK